MRLLEKPLPAVVENIDAWSQLIGTSPRLRVQCKMCVSQTRAVRSSGKEQIAARLKGGGVGLLDAIT